MYRKRYRERLHKIIWANFCLTKPITLNSTYLSFEYLIQEPRIITF